MWKPAKRAILRTARKASVLLLAYCMFATSVWSLALPLPGQTSARFISYTSASVADGHAAMRTPGSSALRNSVLAAPATAVNASALQPYAVSSTVPANCTVHTSHPSRDGDDGQDSYRHYEYDDSSQPVAPAIAPSGFTVFGPQTYVRTTGAPDEFSASITTPAWVVQPFLLHVENGDASGNHRIASGIISINGSTVLSESAFSETIGSIDCAVNLAAHSTLHVTLDSKPGSFITLNILGQSADKTAPVMAVTAPANNTAINIATPHIAISYNDLAGAGEPAASGVNTATLKVLVDGVDRTSLFTKRPDEATADLPSSLGFTSGTHSITASIKDNAGNASQASSQFLVALQPPSLQILQPSPGIFTNTGTLPVQLSYSGSAPIDTTALKVLINNADRTSLFAATATGASATLNSATVLQQGANQISVSIRDIGGNTTSTSVVFNFDTVAPVIIIEHPAPASTHGSTSVEYSIQYSDDQAVDPASLQVAVNGNPLAVSPGPSSVAGTTTLTDGAYTITASIKDKAGNISTVSSTFTVDTTAPDIHILQPAPGAILNSSNAQVQVQYLDSQSLNLQSLLVTEDGANVTSAFTVSPNSATATLQPIADGNHTIAAQIADTTGNIGHATTSLLVDTIKPQLAIVSPTGPVNTVTPAALAQYSDSGSGIDPATVRVFLDGGDVTGSFSVGSTSTIGTLGSISSLPEGPHQFRVKVADRAGNLADTTASFLVDVTAPTVNFSVPANNSFINNTQPDLALNYSDAGSGVNPASIHIFLQQGTAPETEITSLFSIGANQAAGRISAAAPLVEGTYHLRAQVVDNAGNTTSAFSAFEVDTTPPTYTVVSPVANGLINTATPAILVTYEDARSGVDTSKFVLHVDGVDRTATLALSDKQAAGTLPASDALVDGTHTLDVTVVDKAGNAAAQTTESFLVDTIPPVVTIQTPAASSFINLRQPPVSVVYSDAGSGVDLASFTAAIDGVDHTAEFTATAAGATGSLVAALLDGNHIITVTVKDLAGNATTATAAFAVDTVPPQITITQPADGAFTNAVSTAVAGSVLDSSPVTVTVEGVAVPLQGNTFVASAVALGAAPSQVVHVVATDAAGNSSTAAITLKIDRTPPSISATVTPSPNAAGWNSSNVIVSFVCADTESGIATCPAPVPVVTEGANQPVTGTAIDNAGNTAQASVVVKLDKTPPVITATSTPLANAAGWNSSDVTVTYACSDGLSGVVACPAPNVVSTEGKAQQITATVSDQAGNSASTTVQLNIEKNPPAIAALLSPLANGAGWNNTDVTVNFTCTPSASDIVSCPPPVTVTTEGKTQNVPGSVTDQAGKSATTAAIVNIDKTPPLISASAAPPANAAGWNNSDVTVSYICSDSLSGIGICPAPATVSSEGAAQKITAQATDQAGNTAFASTTLSIDKTPPSITAIAAPPPNGAGWNNTNVTVTYSCNDSLSGVANCPSSALVSSEGQNQNISAQATDVAGNIATGSIALSIDKTPPSIVQLSTPDHISRLHGGQIDVTVNDNFSVAQVVISVNGVSLGTFSSAPYQAALQVPAGANPGDTVTVTAQATDEAGNTQTSSRAVRIAADGVIVGQVLSDADSFPITGASVQAIAKTTLTDQTDDHGRYSLQVSDSHVFVSATSASPATTTVEREVFVQEGVGTVPVDARLTPLSAPVAVGSAGGTVKAGTISITVPAGAVADGATVQLTPLSGQGLPGLLPLGWSPLSSFDLRASTSAANLTGAVTGLPNVPVHLIFYNPALHAWTMVSPNLQAAAGSLSFTVPALGDYALVVPDVVDPPIVVPNSGDALTGMDMQLLSSSAITSGSLSPAILPPSGGTATATLGLQSPTFVPSGTVIQANVSEKFSLTSGDVVSQENRTEDIVLYNSLASADSVVGAQFPVKPSRKFANAELLTGKVHLDILAGREGVRGQPGGSTPLVLSDGTSTLSVPANALSEDTAISIESVALEDFIPVSSSFNALQEVIADFSGETLNTPAQLSISSTGLNPADVFLLTKVERVDGVPHIVVVAVAQLNGNALTSVSSPGLPGVMEGGEYVFYDLTAASGFVQGIVSTSAGPISAVVQTDSLPIVSITGVDGRYLVPALTGSVNLKASVPHTALAGNAAVQVTAAQTTQANVVLAGTVTSAVVSPADGTLGVPAGTVITVTTTAPLNPQSIVQSNLVLLKGSASSGSPVPVQPFVLSTSGTVLSFAPQKNLDAATQYTVQVSGLADTFGGAVVVPSATFTTKAVAALNFDPNAITFSFPDANGNIHVSAPAGSLPPGTNVLIIDQANGLVLSLTTFNDGSLNGIFLGSINDVLQITVTSPDGQTASFAKSQFVAADGTVAVGAGGGTLAGSGGVELRIPDGALDKAATFKIESFGPDLFPERPDLSGAHFGGGLTITSPEKPNFNQEVRLAFPKPTDAPDGAFYYVYRRLTGPAGETIFETIDEAFVEGQGTSAKVVMASYPFSGIENSIGTITVSNAGQFGIDAAVSTQNLLMWTIDLTVPLLSTTGVVTGKLTRPVFGTAPGQPVQFEGIPNIPVFFAKADGTPDFTKGVSISQKDGRYALYTDHFVDGPVQVVAQVNGEYKVGTAFEFLPTDVSIFQWLVGLFKRYRFVATANLTFQPLVPPPPAPQAEVHTFSGNPNGRQEVFGIVVAGTPLTIGFKSSVSPLTLSSGAIATIRQGTGPSAPLGLAIDTDSTSNKMDLVGSFTPSEAGSYTVSITIPAVFGGQPVVASHTFLVIAGAGAGNNQVIPGSAPDVISALLVPQDGATGVATDILPQVVFTQPVINVQGNIKLFGDGRFLDLVISAAGVDPQGNPIAIADLNSMPAATAVTAITIKPVGGLEFNTGYDLSIGSGIVSTDPTSPLPLTARDYTFTTFTPQSLGNVDSFASVGMFVADSKVYVASRDSGNSGKMHAYDISDPRNPAELAQGFFSGMAIHMAGEKNSAVASGNTLLAVASTQFVSEGPSNLWFFQDVTPPNQQGVNPNGLQRIGAVSLTGSTQEGTILRVALKDDFAYAITFPKGIQVVDLNAAKQRWSDAMANVNGFTQTGMFNALANPGDGWATDTIVNTIPISSPNSGPGFSQTNALQVDDFVLQDGSSQTLVLTTGQIPLFIANPQTSAVLFNRDTPLPSTLGSLVNGWAMALGKIADPSGAGNDKKIAVVVGNGSAPANPFYQSFTPSLSSGPVLAIMDITNPVAPAPLGFYLLTDAATDVQVNGTTAFVSTAVDTVVIDISNPAKPIASGRIPNTFGRLGLADPRLVLSSSLSGGGLHLVQLDQLRCSTLMGNGVPVPVDFSVSHVNWSMNAKIDPAHGLTLENVVLGQRHMADTMSLPYFILETAGHGKARCQLTNSGTVCDNTDPATRNRLVQFQSSKNANNLTISATYLIDRIFGDPESRASSQVPEACLMVTENFEFDKTVPGDACEPSGTLACTRYKPTVKYQYFHDVNAPDLVSIKMAQRFAFNAIEAPPASNTQSSNAAALFHDCDGIVSTCAFGLPFSGALGFLPIHVVKAFDGQNPLQQESMVRVIQGGNRFDATDDKGVTRSIDNLHQSTQKAVDEPGLHPGCPDCVHMHWRWDANLDPAIHPSIVNARFNGNHGLPLIPAGSNQDVDVAVVRGDRDPNPHTLEELLASSRGSLDPATGDPRPVFWYVGTGHKNSDQFLTHGGFFSDRGTIQGPLITNMSAIATGGTYSVQFTVSGTALPMNYRIQAVDDLGGTFSQNIGTAFPDTPVSIFFTPNPGGSVYIVEVTVEDPVTLLNAVEDILIQRPL